MSHAGGSDSCAGLCTHIRVRRSSPRLALPAARVPLEATCPLYVPTNPAEGGRYFRLCGERVRECVRAFSLENWERVQISAIRVFTVFKAGASPARAVAPPGCHSWSLDLEGRPWTKTPTFNEHFHILTVHGQYWFLAFLSTNGETFQPPFFFSFFFIRKDNLADGCERFAAFWNNAGACSYVCRQQSG